MILAGPFKFEKIDNKIQYTGIGRKEIYRLLKKVADLLKPNKAYIIKVVEMTHAQVHSNYAHMCVKLAADEFGYSSDEFRAMIEDEIYQRAMNPDDDYFDRSEWIIEVADRETGEVKATKLKGMSSWKIGQMSQFIEILHLLTYKQFEGFKFPDPEQYTGQIQGTRIEFANDSMSLTDEQLTKEATK